VKSKKHDRGKMDLAGFILRSPYLRFWANWFSHWTQRCHVNLIDLLLVLRMLCLLLKTGVLDFSWGERHSPSNLFDGIISILLHLCEFMRTLFKIVLIYSSNCKEVVKRVDKRDDVARNSRQASARCCYRNRNVRTCVEESARAIKELSSNNASVTRLEATAI
jgi:hypothetical protein